MKNIPHRERHQRIYLGLSVFIFTLVGTGHLLRIIYDWTVVIGNVVFPSAVSWLALFVALMMVIMGVWYIKH